MGLFRDRIGESRERASWIAALLLFAVLALPPARGWLESDMRLHMLAQFPLLAATGLLAARGLSPRWHARLGPWNRYGITGLLCAALVGAFWMIPKALDEALTQPWMEVAKFLSLSLGAGFALAISWRPAGIVGRGLFLGNCLPMLAVVGWLYLLAPVRLCNAYLPGQQESTGTLLIIIAVLGCLAWLGSFFLAAPAGPARSIEIGHSLSLRSGSSWPRVSRHR